MRALATSVLVLLAAARGRGQEEAWQIPSPPSSWYLGPIAPFVDHDGDGYRDLLHQVILNYGVPGLQTVALQVLSGRDGSVLLAVPQPVMMGMACVGDMDGDGRTEVAIRQTATGVPLQLGIQIYSLATQSVLWQVVGPQYGFGSAMLGDLDTDGDGLRDFVTITSDALDSRVFVYSNAGTQRYVLQISGVHGVAISLAKLGDRDADGADDFLVGINDFSTRGTILLVSGLTGAILRTTQGLLPGDKTCDFVSNVGDMDGDGVDDYAGFPWLSASRAIVVVWSGLTGQVIRTWDEFANSVVVGGDVDQDGVPDLVIGADWQVTTAPPQRYGRTRAYSGRDGTELWRVENLPAFNNSSGSNGGGGWMEYAAPLGVQPGSPYPAVAWYDQNWVLAGTHHGRIRGFRTHLAGQGPVTGRPCSTLATLPLIGVRQTQSSIPSPFPVHTRVTLANAPPGAAAWLNLDYAGATSFAGVPLPVTLDPYGLAGCDLHVGPTIMFFRVLGSVGIDRGYAQVELPRPPASATLGVPFAAQWLVFDPTTLGYAATQKHELRLQ